MQSSFEYYPLLNLARILDHQKSRLYNRSPRLLLLDSSDRLPGFCCSDEFGAGVAPPTGRLVSASDPIYISECLKSVAWTYRQSTSESPYKLLDTLKSSHKVLRSTCKRLPQCLLDPTLSAHPNLLYDLLSNPSIDSPTPRPLINKQDFPLSLQVLQP
jgi:hypothetical protein